MIDTRLGHGLDIPKSRDERARERFVSSLRAHVLTDVAASMQQAWENDVLPAFRAEHDRDPANAEEVHAALKPHPQFRFYSSLRCTAQEAVWNAVIDELEDDVEAFNRRCAEIAADRSRAQGTLELDPALELPRSATAVDVHLMPGNYHGSRGSRGDDDAVAGAIYDNGLNVFAFGVMGEHLDDIGLSMSNFVRLRFPDLAPGKILDVGCTIGHNTVPWKRTFPDAEVHGVDIAAPCLRYAHARAQALGETVHFHQQAAESLAFPDASVDVVFSSMFLHELPLKSIRAFLAEAHRVLRPGGVLINMELPPNSATAPYDGFYLDWDSYYNNEPYYKGFRDQDYRELCTSAGFAEDAFFEAVMPRYGYVAEDAFAAAISADAAFDEDTGRLSDIIMWYGFGARR